MAKPTILVHPPLIDWALARAQKSKEELSAKHTWIESGKQPTLKDLKDFAKATYTPVGFFFLDEVPKIEIPIKSFRTVGSAGLQTASANLLETVFLMEARQEWMREFFINENEPALNFVGSISVDTPVEIAAERIREDLGLAKDWATEFSSPHDLLRDLRNRAEQKRILVFINGVVKNTNIRKLNVDEFRGFVLSDEFAPLIFINASDAKVAQVFTFLHELVHLWLGFDDIFQQDFEVNQVVNTNTVELFCNSVAAEVLIPKDEFFKIWNKNILLKANLDRVSKKFNTSRIVTARRALELRVIGWDIFQDTIKRFHSYNDVEPKSSNGGDFWNTQGFRLGRILPSALNTAYQRRIVSLQQVYELTGLKRSTFLNAASKL